MERNNKPTPVEWLQELYDSRPAYEEFILPDEFERAKQMEREQRIDDYNVGYADATCRYPNSAHEYVKGADRFEG